MRMCAIQLNWFFGDDDDDAAVNVTCLEIYIMLYARKLMASVYGCFFVIDARRTYSEQGLSNQPHKSPPAEEENIYV